MVIINNNKIILTTTSDNGSIRGSVISCLEWCPNPSAGLNSTTATITSENQKQKMMIAQSNCNFNSSLPSTSSTNSSNSSSPRSENSAAILNKFNNDTNYATSSYQSLTYDDHPRLRFVEVSALAAELRRRNSDLSLSINSAKSCLPLRTDKNVKNWLNSMKSKSRAFDLNKNANFIENKNYNNEKEKVLIEVQPIYINDYKNQPSIQENNENLLSRYSSIINNSLPDTTSNSFLKILKQQIANSEARTDQAIKSYFNNFRQHLCSLKNKKEINYCSLKNDQLINKTDSLANRNNSISYCSNGGIVTTNSTADFSVAAPTVKKLIEEKHKKHYYYDALKKKLMVKFFWLIFFTFLYFT